MRKYKLSINNSDFDVLIKEVTKEEVTAEVNGQQHIVQIRDIEDLSKVAKSTGVKEVENKTISSQSVEQTQASSSPQSSTPKAASGAITAPIPGQIISINVSAGEKVLKGQKLMILEAMKLENVITSDSDGTVQQLMVKEGEVIEQGQELIIIF